MSDLVNRALNIFKLRGVSDGIGRSSWDCICAFAVWVKPVQRGFATFPPKF